MLQALDDLDIHQLEDDIPIEPTRKGTIIASPHQEKQKLYMVKSGAVRLYSITAEGKEFTLDILGAGYVFGDPLFSDKNPYAVTLEDSIICSMDHERFQSLLREKPELGIRFIQIISERVKEVEELLEHMTYSSVRKRLLFLLHKLSQKFGASIAAGTEADEQELQGWVELQVELTHQELASMTGSIRETVTETLNQLTTEGILKKNGMRKPLWVHVDRLQAGLQELR
ncbi:MAG: putative transcriptional regulator [Brevibacillus sp.]|nr:putative transcriptional regulator [Brevibacillus sp.]